MYEIRNRDSGKTKTYKTRPNWLKALKTLSAKHGTRAYVGRKLSL
jgi:hypothetical protein